MSRALLGLLSTPDRSQYVVVYEGGTLSLFLPAHAPTPVLSPLAADLEQWASGQDEAGVEAVRLLPGFPVPLLTFTRIERLANLARPRLELRGFAPQPWAGLLPILKAQFDGDPTAPTIPDGYTFTPATRTEAASVPATC